MVERKGLCKTCVDYATVHCLNYDKIGSVVICDNYLPKSGQTCPTCKHSRQDGDALFTYAEGNYTCTSPNTFNMTKKNGILYCTAWEEKPKPIELKPCPMCGGHAVMNRMDLYGVICTRRGSVYCPGNTNAANSAEEAARLWNERPE